MGFSEVFYTGLYTSLLACVIAVGRMCYKSKCKKVKICCLTIVRDVEMELVDETKESQI